MGETSPIRSQFEITPLLSRQNEILLEVELTGPLQVGPEVWLEIRERQYLDKLRLEIELAAGRPQLRVQGHVAGEPHEGPLELVVRGPEEELLYAPVTVGSTICLLAELPLAHGRIATREIEFQVRLIRGGTRVWEARRTVKAGC
jgi:hypothetical protein